MSNLNRTSFFLWSIWSNTFVFSANSRRRAAKYSPDRKRLRKRSLPSQPGSETPWRCVVQNQHQMAFQQLESIGRGSIIDKIKCLKIPEISAIGPMYISWIKPYPTVKPSIFRNPLFFPHYPLVWLGNGYSGGSDIAMPKRTQLHLIMIMCLIPMLFGWKWHECHWLHAYIHTESWIHKYCICILCTQVYKCPILSGKPYYLSERHGDVPIMIRDVET